MNNDKNSAKPLTREVLEDFTNRCARLNMYEQGSDEYLALRSALDEEAYGYCQMSDYEQIVKEDGKEGVKNGLLNYYIVPPVFDKVMYATNICHNYIVAKNGKYGITKADGKGTMALPCMFDSIEMFNTFLDVVKFKAGGKWGIIELYSDGCAKVVTGAEYDEICETDTQFLLLRQERKYGLYRYGYILPAGFDRIFVPEILGWIKVMQNGVWGYVDADNKFTERLDEAFLHICY
ncbi:MAG: WG repeat-containing protein [Bacteroidaceae bacterium]|nr:WG repeat-containing protein [Bacteroidaceae bacterium]